MTDNDKGMRKAGNGKGQSGWGRLVSRLDREGDGRELLPGIVVRDGKIAPGPGAADPSNWIEVGKFAVSAGRLLWDVMRDERVPLRGKVLAGAAAAYAVSPLDVIPDFVPVAGYIDDVFIVVGALRYLADTAGHDILRELWDGSDEGFTLLMGLVGRD